MGQIDIERYRSQLIETFKAHDVVLAYLFGSQATGKAGPLSDVDVAVLLETMPRSLLPWHNPQTILMGELARVLQRNDVDVVLLNEATPLLGYEIMRHGRVIYTQSELVRVNFETRMFHQYVDTQPLRDALYAAFVKRSRARVLQRKQLAKGLA